MAPNEKDGFGCSALCGLWKLKMLAGFESNKLLAVGADFCPKENMFSF